MNYRNLKIHTAINLFFTILFAMVLINSVILIFWYEHLVKQQFTLINQIIANNYIEIIQILINESNASKKSIEQLIGFKHFGITGITFSYSNSAIKEHKPRSSKEIVHQIGTGKTTLPDKKVTFLLPMLFNKKKVFNLNFERSPYNNTNMSIDIQIDTSNLALQIWNKERIIILYLIFNTFILTTILFFRFRRTLFTPLDNLLNVANNYYLHESIWDPQPSNTGEFDQLSQAINAMVFRIEKDRDKLLESVKKLQETNNELKLAQQETIQVEKLASTGRLAAGLAHEIGNPVTIIQGYLELVKKQTFTEHEKHDFLERSLRELEKIDSLLFQLMNLANNRQKNKSIISPYTICEELLNTLKPTLSNSNIVATLLSQSTNLLVFCAPDLFHQIILNLFLNSMDAIIDNHQTHGGTIHCELQSIHFKGIPHVLITFQDNGEGIDKDHMDLIFDPFFTTKPIGKGTGLGLSVVQRIIESFNGHIEVQSLPSQGTSFRVFIPQYFKDKSNE